MMNLYVWKGRLITFYQKYEIYIMPILKFIVAISIFHMINQAIGYELRLTKFPLICIASLICAFTPSVILVLFAAIFSLVHIYTASQILSIIVLFVYLILYLLFIRFTPKLGYVVLAMPILYILKVPYFMPLLLGLSTNPLSAISVACGVILHFFFQIIKEAAIITMNTSVEDALSLFTFVIDSLLQNKMMLFSIVIFILVILATYFVRQLSIDYAFYIATLTGMVVNILAFLVLDLSMDISNQITGMVIGTIVSTVIVIIIQFFRLSLDYSRVERVQFEDDDYYYYVKAIPKINVTTPKIKVKRINPQKVNDFIDKNRDGSENYRL